MPRATKVFRPKQRDKLDVYPRFVCFLCGGRAIISKRRDFTFLHFEYSKRVRQARNFLVLVMTTSPTSPQLPFLIRLMDDASPRVRERVAAQLCAFGDNLEAEIAAQGIVLSASQRLALSLLRIEERVAPISWLSWRSRQRDSDKIEDALSYLSKWQASCEAPNEYSFGASRQLDLMPPRSQENEKNDDTTLSELLDELAQEFRATGRPWHPEALSAWLFVEQGFRGDTLDYYNVRNSDLRRVIEDRRGIPISLACVFLLVGARLGLDIRGCNFPGHFLVHARTGGVDLLFDCFDAGRLLTPFETNAIRKAEPSLLSQRTTPESIVARVLRNLAVSYEHSGQRAQVQFAQTLLNELQQAEDEE